MIDSNSSFSKDFFDITITEFVRYIVAYSLKDDVRWKMITSKLHQSLAKSLKSVILSSQLLSGSLTLRQNLISLEGKTIYEPMPTPLKIMFQKEKAWQHEEEFRLVLADTNDDDKNYKLIENGIINSVDKIIFGYKADKEQLIKNFKEKYHETNILFFKASPSTDQYNITSDLFLYLEDGEVKEKKDPILVDFLNSFLIGRQSVDRKIDDIYLSIREFEDALIKQLKNGDFSEIKRFLLNGE